MLPKLATKHTVTLDQESHRYYVDGALFDGPSITQVIKPYGKDYSQIDPWYASRGTAVHLGCALMNENRLDWASVDPAVEPYLRSYEKFLTEATCKPISWETPLYSEKWGFCGTYDLICELATEQLVLFDIKTAKSVDRSVELQLMGQDILWAENNEDDLGTRGYLQLMSDGSEPKTKFYARDAELFLSALKLWKWRK